VSFADLANLQAGNPFYITLTRDDDPEEVGTPYSKAAVLPDSLASVICPGVVNPAPADAFSGLNDKIESVSAVVDVKLVEDVDEITSPGYYSVPINVDGYFGYYVFHAVGRGQNIHLTGSVDGFILHKSKVNGVWQEWEWQNPPMMPAAEYRTIERHEGKPIYTKVVSLGTLPDTSSKTIPHNITNLGVMVSSFVSFGENGRFPYVVPYYDSSKNTFTIMATVGEVIIITTTLDVSHYSGIAVLRYTKA
jgi:hypothetical protein